ncbi:MAG: hypothetical protein SFU56_15020 [Capsulimonadales bacterium]|nr:hypothetical protein [Capsulimonadales bacterium]
MDIHDWMDDFMRQAYECRDRVRWNLGLIVMEGMQSLNERPTEAREALEKARSMAEALSEPWWVALCDHWLCQIHLNKIPDSAEAIRIVDQALIRLQQGVYRDLPQRICLHEDAIIAYRNVDPIGYREKIEDALRFMRENVGDDTPCRHCLRLLEVEGAIDEGRSEEADRMAEDGLRMARKDPFFVSQFYARLCRIAFVRNDFESLRHWSGAGKLFVGRMGNTSSNIELLMWEALALEECGRSEEAARRCRLAEALAQRSGQVPDSGYFDALATYREYCGQPGEALAVRGLELLQSVLGAPYLECLCRLKRLRLLIRLGRSTTDEMRRLRQAATAIEDPTDILREAEEIVARSGVKAAV